MKPLFSLSLIVILSYTAAAQDKLPSFGKIDKADVEMKQCSFEPDAEAMVLFDFGDSYYNIGMNSVGIEARYRKRIKIFKESAKDRADIKIPYYSKNGYEDIQSIEAIAYNLDEGGNIVTTKLEKKMVFDKKINDRWSEISFAIPAVKAGTVIEYKYVSWKKSNISDLEDWIFQSDIPVKYSAYNIHIPQYFDFNYKFVRRQEVEIKKEDGYDAGYWFIMHNVPSLKDEPYMSNRKDYMQRVDFDLATIRVPGEAPINVRSTWPKIAEELDQNEWFGSQLRKNVPGTGAPIRELLNGEADVDKKINIIYSFVQSQMSWNDQETIGSFNGIKQAWDKKSGSTGDINLLLVNLLRENDITAYPILVSTRENGTVNTFYPSLSQFDNVYAYAEGKEKKYILNAADKYNPAYLYPYDVQMTNGLIMKREKTEWMSIFDEQSKYKQYVFLMMNISNQLEASGQASIESSDYCKNVMLSKNRRSTLKDFYSKNEAFELAIDSFKTENTNLNASPFKQNVFFKGQLTKDNDYVFVPYNLFLGLEKNPFVAEKRQTDIDFGYRQSYSMKGTILLPDGYEVELPKNIRMILPDTSISATRIMQVSDKIINIQLDVSFNYAVFGQDSYDDVKEVYKQLYALLSEQIILKKKK